MNASIAQLQGAQRQNNVAATAQLLAEVVQQQHPDSPLTLAAQQQFRCCCAHLAVRAGAAGACEALLLAADVCFGYAYHIPGAAPHGRCPHH